MTKSKRLLILSESEIHGLYERPQFTAEQRRYFFALNDQEKDVINQLRSRKYRCMAIALLGYFKSKPVLLEPKFKEMLLDLQFIADTHFDGLKLRRFTINRVQKARIYEKVFFLMNYSQWSIARHNSDLTNYLTEQIRAWALPRHLFDAAIEYLSSQNISIPAYSTLQKIITRVITQEQIRLIEDVNQLISQDLKKTLYDIVKGDDTLPLRRLRQSARNFTGTELEKELAVHRHIQHWVPEVNVILSKLSLSQKNQQYLAERVDYYGAKMKRQSVGKQRLYLLCYAQSRWQQALERIADGFVHHVRQIKQKAKVYAQEAVYQDWQNAAKNVGKAADVLRLFIDDDIDQRQPFGTVKQQALKLLAANELESVCLFLNEQKRSVDEAIWQFYDEKDSLRKGLLRELFLCLRFEGIEGTQRLVTGLESARDQLSENGALSASAIDIRLPAKKSLRLLQGSRGNIKLGRYEWYLYHQIPERLNGQLTLPDIVKYRPLDADLISRERWREEKGKLLEKTQLPKLTAEPNKLIKQMTMDLEIRLYEVSEYLEQDDNRNIVLRNPKGKRLWRLPTTSKKYLVNNPFFQQLPTTGVADVLRMVDRDTGFINCFEHVLGSQSKSRAYEYDLLAILVGNATNQGVYGMAQISDRTYDQLSTIQANYLRLETLSAANDNINNATSKLPIFKHYNIQEDIVHASADGQKFGARRETFKTRYSSKYFGTQKGVSAMSLIANHAAINARVIGANEHESHYIFDLLMNNSSEITPDVLSTDTHGVNHVNFALLDLFGYSFAPRYAQVGRVINEIFDEKEDKDKRIQLRLKKPINTKRIMQHWDTIQRISVSLKERKTTQATLVRKLSEYKKNHPLLEALTEYNRLVKANYLLNYIEDASLRNYVQRALNRGDYPPLG